MLKHWDKLLNTDCTVVDVGEHTIYPIFRVGSTSLIQACDKKHINHDIANCQHIDVMIRDPESRYRSGVNEYCHQKNLDVIETCNLIERGKLHDRHFAPQYIWLIHLYKFYKGAITIRPFEYLKNITDVHMAKSVSKVTIPVCKSFVDVDQYLTKYYNQTIAIGDLIKRYRNVLS